MNSLSVHTFAQVALAVIGLTGLRGDDLTSSTVLVQGPRTESQRALALVDQGSVPWILAAHHGGRLAIDHDWGRLEQKVGARDPGSWVALTRC